MKTRYISGEEVYSLPLENVIEIVEAAFRGFLEPGVIQPPRSELLVEDGSRFLGVMPTHILEYNVFTVKVIDYPFDGRPFKAMVIVYDLDDPSEVCIVDGESVTTLRTAGMGLVSTKHLKSNPKSIAVVGTGVQGRAMLDLHLRYFTSIEKVFLYNRSRVKAESLAVDIGKHVDVDVADASDDAVKDADVVILSTTSLEPVITGEEVMEGAHVISIGYMGRDSREFGPMLLRRASKIYLDGPDARDSGDIRIPLHEGVLDDSKIYLFSEYLLGKAPGRTRSDEITVFKSVGTAVQDGYMAYYIWMRLARG